MPELEKTQSVAIVKFISVGYVKDQCPPFPLLLSLFELRQRIGRAIDSVNVTTLNRVWSKLDYRIDDCYVPKRVHIEHL